MRIGGVYALERIAMDSKTDRLTIVEVLTSFVRLNSALTPGTEERSRPQDPDSKIAAARDAAPAGKLRVHAPHIQAAMTVIGWLPTLRKDQPHALARVDLRRSDLGYADLSDVDFHYSDLSQAFLIAANLCRADLTGVWFARAVMIRARLHQADLRTAVLWQARLEAADLRATDLTGADLTGAFLERAQLDLADLRGADFTAADLSGASFRGVVADDTTKWPPGFESAQAGILSGATAPPLRPRDYFS